MHLVVTKWERHKDIVLVLEMAKNPLSEQSNFPKCYSPQVLFGISRLSSRVSLGINKDFDIKGIDHWRAYEVSWRDTSGKTEVRVGEFFFNVESKNIIESKSLKLYLHSFNEERFSNEEDVKKKMAADLSSVSGSKVFVSLHTLDSIRLLEIKSRVGRSIDNETVSSVPNKPDNLLLDTFDTVVEGEQLYSDLFRSVCPVTGQPDWGSFQVKYSGAKICESGLLSYLCSYRTHDAYHEECAEQIFHDILAQCCPKELLVSLNFLRRGGIDINVYRSTEKLSVSALMTRLVRQ